jgi:hypothetical protein
MRPAPILLGSNANMVLLLLTTPNSVGRRCAASRSLAAKLEGNCAQQRRIYCLDIQAALRNRIAPATQ